MICLLRIRTPSSSALTTKSLRNVRYANRNLAAKVSDLESFDVGDRISHKLEAQTIIREYEGCIEDGHSRPSSVYYGSRHSHWRKTLYQQPRSSRSTSELFPTFSGVESIIISHLFPAGYPGTISLGYRSYAGFQFLACLTGSAASVLSTQALLYAVGVVGSGSSAGATAAAMNWVIKDGIGQFGGIIFASYIGKLRGFDKNPKKWRMSQIT